MSQEATRPDFTFDPDERHTYGMKFTRFAETKVLTRWFATPEDGKRFAARNAISPIAWIRWDGR